MFQLTSGKSARFNDLFSQKLPVVARLVWADVLLGLAVIVTTILLVIALVVFELGTDQGLSNLIWALIITVEFIVFFWVSVRIQFYNLIIVDQQLGAVEAMRASWRITKGHFGLLIRYGLLSVLVVLLGLVALGVGIFVAAPIVELGRLHLYRQFTRESSSHTDELAQPTQ